MGPFYQALDMGTVGWAVGLLLLLALVVGLGLWLLNLAERDVEEFEERTRHLGYLDEHHHTKGRSNG